MCIMKEIAGRVIAKQVHVYQVYIYGWLWVSDRSEGLVLSHMVNFPGKLNRCGL